MTQSSGESKRTDMEAPVGLSAEQERTPAASPEERPVPRELRQRGPPHSKTPRGASMPDPWRAEPRKCEERAAVT